MSLTSNEPSSVRVLRIPELARKISDRIERRNAARLGCTCRELFRSFMPLAWEHVWDAGQVLSLIRGSIVYMEYTDGSVSCVRIVSFMVLLVLKVV